LSIYYCIALVTIECYIHVFCGLQIMRFILCGIVYNKDTLKLSENRGVNEVKITWYGHSCFLIDTGKAKIMTDPFDSSVGYEIPNVEPDIITESHQHFDHNAHHLIKGNFNLIRDPTATESKGVRITGISTFHDKEKGAKRGSNIIFIYWFDNFKVSHLGDLGDIPSQSQLDMLKEVDVLMIPVGGVFTIGPDEAKKIVEIVNPHVVIPMHYKTPRLKFNLSGVEEFAKLFSLVSKHPTSSVTLSEKIKEYSQKVIVLSI